MNRISVSVTDMPGLCYRIRKAVFIDEQGFSEDRDEHDATAMHLLAENTEGPVGAARIVFDDQTATIGRVCLLPHARGGGSGAELMRAALTIAKGVPGITKAKLSAQVRAMNFYETLGFEAVGEPYDDLGIPHQTMVRAL